MIRIAVVLTAFALSAPALAAEPQCAFKRPIDLALDVAGVKTVVFRVGAQDIDVQPASGPARITGQACASSQKLLDGLQVTQQRTGDTLTVQAQANGASNFRLFDRGTNALLKLNAGVPADARVQVIVGAGDACVRGVREVSADVGSGDVAVQDVRGGVYAKVGSGDINLARIGSLHVLGVGSGDLVAREVRGTARIDDVNSGDVTVTGVGGTVEVGSVGSGDVAIRDAGGSVRIGSVSSGDVQVHGVRGDLTVQHVGSGDVRHGGVSGQVQIGRHQD